MYIGSNAVDDIKIGSSQVDAIYLGDTQVWSAIPADVKAHIARVTADGGTVPEQAKMIAMVKKLIAANLWNNCVFFGLPLGGVKKDGNEYVSKVYDLKANADLLQSTGTAQPKYDTDGSLLYDGGDKLMTGNLLTSNPITQCTSNITVICWVNIITIGMQFIFDRYNITDNKDAWAIVQRATGVMGAILLSNSGFLKTYDTTAIIGTGWKCLAFTYSITGEFLLYVNGVNQSVTKVVDNINVAINNVTSPLALGQRTVSTSNPYLSGNKATLPQIYNATFTPEQILWNFNNIRPEGV